MVLLSGTNEQQDETLVLAPGQRHQALGGLGAEVRKENPRTCARVRELAGGTTTFNPIRKDGEVVAGRSFSIACAGPPCYRSPHIDGF